MDFNGLINYLESHQTEYEDLYRNDKKKFLNLANSLFLSLPNCNISLLDSSNFNACFRVIRSFSSKEETFEKWIYVKNIIDFTLLNLVTIKYEEQTEDALKLLNFLDDILNRVQICHSDRLDTNRIFKVVSQVMSDDINKTRAVLNILETVMKLPVIFPESLTIIVEKAFVSLHTQSNVQVICILAKIVLERLTDINPRISHRILEWILKKSCVYISQDSEINILEEILSLIVKLKSKNITILEQVYPNFSEDEENLWDNFMKLSDKLWYLCREDHSVSLIARDIFSRTVVHFLMKEDMMYGNLFTTLEELRAFFEKTNNLGYIVEKYFFHICHMQVLHSSLVWKPKLVLRSMAEIFYDANTQAEIPLLKSFFYLYPCLVTSMKPNYVAYGSDYLRAMALYSRNPKIYTFCEEQLVWIFILGSKSLKMEVMRQWLMKNSYHRTLIRIINYCKSEKLLLYFMIENPEDDYGKLAANFLHNLKNEELAKEIADNLPVFHRDSNIFKCLLLSRPGLPDDVEKKMLLLELMIAVIPILSGNDVLKAACIYTNQLVKNLQYDPRTLKKFTTYISTIEFLLSSVTKMQEVSEKIFILLKNLISVQVKHQYQVGNHVEIDLVLLLKNSDSTRQTKEYLSILPIILRSKEIPLFKLKNELNLVLWYNIMDVIEKPDVQDVGFVCLQTLMSKYEWLAFSSSVSSFIARCCCMQSNHEKSKRLMNFINAWMKILAGSPKFLRPSIPYREIESFVMRSNNSIKINYFSKLLELMHRDKVIQNNS